MQAALDGINSEQAEVMAHVLADKGTTYRPEFYHWLKDNWGIWKRFQIEADKMRAKGLKHYSARTIVHYLRHETALREDGVFKINNDASPDMGRLYMTLRQAPGFFETRGR